MNLTQEEIYSINCLCDGNQNGKYKRLYSKADENYFIKILVYHMENNICFILHNNSTELYREVVVSEYDIDRFEYFIGLKSKLYSPEEESEYYEQFVEEINLEHLNQEIKNVVDQLNSKIEAFLNKIQF